MAHWPHPIDTSGVELPPALVDLRERLAQHAHDVWARRRLEEGWRLGTHRDDHLRTHPGLVPYGELPESEKQYDRDVAVETLKAIMALGYQIERRPAR